VCSSDLTIPDSVTEAHLDTFSGCCNLTSITFPNNNGKVAEQLFRGATNATFVFSDIDSEVQITLYSGYSDDMDYYECEYDDDPNQRWREHYDPDIENESDFEDRTGRDAWDSNWNDD
jgi:hypothetical protein